MAGAAAAASSAKVKLLCSYGGHIIPRPSDGALRYAGGQTRIVAVPRTASLPDIHRKLAAVFGAPAAIRYQLPDVDLDALVSVSSPEDLDNMMEEYDKIAETAPDGSAKLRVFLDISSEPSPNIDYVEAVNRVSSDGSFRRANSGNNSGGTINGGMSPELLSPNAGSSNDPNRLFFVGVPEAVPVSTAAGRVELELSPYSSQPYGDPSQLPYLNPKLAGPAVDSLLDGRVQSDANVPYQGVSQQSALASSYLQANIDLYGLEQVVQQQQSLGQGLDCLMCQKALPHAHSDTVVQGQGSGMSEVSAGFQSLRPEDAMRLRAPPRVVADPMAESMVERRNGNVVAHAPFVAYGRGQNPEVRYVNEKIVVPNTKGSDPLMVMPAPAALGLPGDSMVEQETRKLVVPAQFAAYRPQTQEIRPEDEKLVVPNSKASGQPQPMLAPAVMGLPSDAQASNALYVNIHQPQQLPPVQALGQPQRLIKQDVIAELCSNGVDPVRSQSKSSLQQQPQQPLLQPLGQPRPVIKQDGTTEIRSNGVYTVNGVNSSEPLDLVDMTGFPYNYASQLEGMTDGRHVNPFDSVVNGERNPTGTPTRVISKEFKPESQVLAENNLPVRSQVVGNSTFLANGFSNPTIMPERTYVRPVDPLLPSSLGFTQLHNLQPPLLSQVSTEEAFFFNQEMGREPITTSGPLNGMLAYSINPAQSYTISKVPNGIRKEEASQYPKNLTADLVAPPNTKLPFPFPDSCCTIQHAELKDEPVLADPHFFNQDIGKIVGGTSLLPPRPARVASNAPAISKDIATEKLSVNNRVPNIAPVLDNPVLHQPSNSLINDSESSIRAARDFGEEQIDKQLQAVAEGAAASVLQSIVPPVPMFVATETKKSQVTQEGRVTEDITSSLSGVTLNDHKIEIKETDKLNPGFLIGDEIGRLQIIKNSDLEELRELGSGTFGTVYHGKWRGSDVAIKRINNRCFSGKPSEQERSRADFWNEASKLSDLHHPNVVAFYGVVVDGPSGSIATVTEYMVNGSLRQALHKNDKILERSKRLLIAMDVAFGMEYLHGRNIVHFDLKSDNLLVNLRDPQRPICKVGDLGLSKVKCQTLISGGVRGTLPWMAPELLNGSSNLVSDKVDVFSFGIVMWEMLTGKEPYADMHYGAIIGGIVNNTLRPPVPESCEPDWRLLMEKCWSSQSLERPSFTEIASALRAMAASPPMKGRQLDQQPGS